MGWVDIDFGMFRYLSWAVGSYSRGQPAWELTQSTSTSIGTDPYIRETEIDLGSILADFSFISSRRGEKAAMSGKFTTKSDRNLYFYLPSYLPGSIDLGVHALLVPLHIREHAEDARLEVVGVDMHGWPSTIHTGGSLGFTSS